MPLTVNSDAGAVGRAHISMSGGEKSDDQVAELIRQLHLSIAEMVRIFAITQQANRDFKNDFSDIRATITAMQLDLNDIRKDSELGATNNVRLHEILSAASRITAKSEEYDSVRIGFQVALEQSVEYLESKITESRKQEPADLGELRQELQGIRTLLEQQRESWIVRLWHKLKALFQ